MLLCPTIVSLTRNFRIMFHNWVSHENRKPGDRQEFVFSLSVDKDIATIQSRRKVLVPRFKEALIPPSLLSERLEISSEFGAWWLIYLAGSPRSNFSRQKRN